MSQILKFSDPSNLPKLVDIIHDCWFEMEDVSFDEKSSILIIKFGKENLEKKEVVSKILFLKKNRVPTFECYMKIHHVNSYEIIDQEKVGKYDFNEVKYDPSFGKIVMTTGIPLGFEVTVDKFEVSIEETDKMIEERISLSV